MPPKTKGLSESLEDYLETIFELEATHKVARVKDIAEKLGVLRGSVTGALKTLAARGLINYAPYSLITLTDKGRTIAREVARRHAVIADFLKNVLQLDEAAADENACRMEHAMDQAAVNRLVQFIEYIQNCPRTGSDWIDAFVNYYGPDDYDLSQCKPCVERCYHRYLSQNSP